MIDNIQFSHNCSQSASLHRDHEEDNNEPVNNINAIQELSDVNTVNDPEPDIFKAIVTEDNIQTALDRPFSNYEILYANIAISIGKDCGALNEDKYATALQAPAAIPSTDQVAQFDVWQNCLSNLPCKDNGKTLTLSQEMSLHSPFPI